MHEQEITQDQSRPSYQKLKTMVKRQIDQRIRTRNFQARNGMRHEYWLRLKKREECQRSKGIRRMLPVESKRCSKVDVCSFRHDGSKRGKKTQSSSLASGRHKMTEEKLSKGKCLRDSGLSSRKHQRACRHYLTGNCTDPSCNSWHPPVCQNYISESGC